MLNADEHFSLYVVLGFPLAYVLSVSIEGVVLKLAAGKFPIDGPFRLSLVANTLGYVALAGLVWIMT